MCAADLSASVQDRIDKLHRLTEFTEKCRTQLTEVFEALNWSQDWSQQSSQQDKLEICPYDANHTVPSRSMECHKATCLLNQLEYSKDEQADMIDPSFCYERVNVPCIKLDKHEQEAVIQQARMSAPSVQSVGSYCQGDYSTQPAEVPQNHKRALCDLTVADRLALYNHVIQKATQQSTKAQESSNDDLYVDLVSKLNKDEEKSGPKTHLEVMAEMRDYRRRRQSYRAKNVHITKKSYTEIIREVIDVHSNELASLWQDKAEEESKASRCSHRKPSDERRSASVDSRGSHSSSREEHSSRQKRHKKRSRDRNQDRDSKRRNSRSPKERHHKKKKKKS